MADKQEVSDSLPESERALAAFLLEAGLVTRDELRQGWERRTVRAPTLADALTATGALSAEAARAAVLLCAFRADKLRAQARHCTRTLHRRFPPPEPGRPPRPLVAPGGGSTARFGDYQILQELGRGAFGVVYQARRLADGMLVALKVMPRATAPDAEKDAERFSREAQVLEKLDHRNVVKFVASGEADGVQFLAMEYIAGQSLKALIHRRPLDLAQAARLAAAAAEGLAHIHQAGLLHRDIKPANLMVQEDETLVIVDFGLAWAREDPALTTTGALVGTPMYMAPERLLGERRLLGPPSDLYALGTTLFEALTGRPPFEPGDNYDIIRQVLYEEPRALQDDLPDAPDRMVNIVRKAMAREPERRYQTARALAQDLQKCSLELKISSLSALSRASRRRPRRER